MIHPTINLVFPDNDKSALFFSWICQRIKKIDELAEFIKWHLDVNKEVIREIANTQNIDFSNESESRKWAKEFLQNYEEKIRRMRQVSNLVFERFYKLKENEFEKIIDENEDREEKIAEMMQIFLNRKELLIGKIIFAYRETWFLANQINNPDFKLGSIKKYKKWVKDNFSNLKELDKSLEIIHTEIARWKG
ncbi:MAG: hypothetical protein ACR2LL_12615 [Nitrosopumilus sp.]